MRALVPLFSQPALQLANIGDGCRTDTGEPVPLPFRMSAFVPTNLIIVAGMLMPNPSTASVLFWQWANQSLNGVHWLFPSRE